jgi:MoxR-like ATPase
MIHPEGDQGAGRSHVEVQPSLLAGKHSSQGNDMERSAYPSVSESDSLAPPPVGHAGHRDASSKSTTNSAEVRQMFADIRAFVARAVVGQDIVVERIIIALLTGGHLLLQGVPGLAKTLLVNSVARAIQLRFGRVQFTIDLLPSDIVGSEVLDPKSGAFHLRQGPVFTNLLLADEINRAAPKVQSALLEAMQERRVTIGMESISLPTPFLVIATQNPIEQAGTFELPEAQLDRFMLCHRLDYPPRADEVQILEQSLQLGLTCDGAGAVPQTAFDLIAEEPVASLENLVQAMGQVQQVYVSRVFTEHCVELVRRTREHRSVDLGASPRAGIALVTAARARALIRGRDHAIPDDLFALAEDVLLHRIRLTYEALAEGVTGRAVLQEILSKIGGAPYDGGA